jgi:hypothetical protein
MVEVTREAFKKRLQEDITPLDVVAGILYYFGEGATFPTDYQKLHESFYAERANSLVQEFKFKESGPYPYSELLESVFARIAISGLLGCKNPDYSKYTVSSAQLKKIETSALKKFSQDKKEELRELSQRIRTRLK